MGIEYISISEEIEKTPHFPDECGHGMNCFIGSISYVERDMDKKTFEEKWIDVYLFKGTDGVQEVCIRFGEYPHQYYSPTNLFQFVSAAGNPNTFPAYKKALALLYHEGYLTFHQKGKSEITDEEVTNYLNSIKEWKTLDNSVTARQLYERLTKTHKIEANEALDIISTAMNAALLDEKEVY